MGVAIWGSCQGQKIVSGPNFNKKDIKKRLKLVWYLFEHLQMFVHNWPDYYTGPGLYGVRLYGGAVQNRTLRREKSTAWKKQDSTAWNIIIFLFFIDIFYFSIFD